MPTSPRGPIAPTRDWDALRRAYETCEGDLAGLALDHGLKLDTLKRYASRYRWQRPRAEPSLPAGRKKPPAADKPKARPPTRAGPRPTTGRRRLSLAGQLKRTLRLKLEKIEMDIEAAGSLDPEAHERHTRALSNLTRSVEAVDELTRPGAAARKPDPAKPAAELEAAGNDADKLRRELAARIKRLRERLER